MVGWRAGRVGQEKGSVAGSAELELALISDMGLLLKWTLNVEGLTDSSLNHQFPGFSDIRLCGNTQSQPFTQATVRCAGMYVKYAI